MEFPQSWQRLSFVPAGIRWYGLSYLVGFGLAWLLIRRVASVGVSSLKSNQAADLVVTVAIGIVVGGRLGYVFFYRPSLLWMFYDHLPFWGVLAINEGGMASHGGMIGAILASLYFARRYQHQWLYLFDLVTFGAPIGLCLGRIANFINGELFGRPCAEGFRWAVKFPQEMLAWNSVGLEQLQPAFDALPTTPYRVDPVPQIIEQIQRGNEQVIQLVEPLLTPRHPSQIYAALLEGLAVFAVLVIVWIRPRKPGVLGGSAFVSYAIARIIDELYRMPDAHIGIQWGLTRGQWLSIGVLVAGLVFIVVSLRRRAEPMGGWRRVETESTRS